MTFVQGGAFSGLTATDLSVPRSRKWWRKRLDNQGLRSTTVAAQRGRMARKGTEMTEFEKMVAALKTSLTETAAAGRADRDEQLAKSVDQFAERVAALLEAEAEEMEAEVGEALAKAAPEPSEADHVTLLGNATLNAADAVRAIERGDTVLMAGGAAPSEGNLRLAKAAIDLLSNAVQLMAAEQSTPIDEGEAVEEGLGLTKVALAGGGDIMVKHALSEPAMTWLADPGAVSDEAVEAAVDALDALGVDVSPLFKSAEEDDEDYEGEEGDEDEGEDFDGEEEDDSGEPENAFVDIARLGSLMMNVADQARAEAEAEGADEGTLEAITALAEFGARATVQADQLLRSGIGDFNDEQDEGYDPQAQEGGQPQEDEEEDEEEMAQAAGVRDLAKAARARLGLGTPKASHAEVMQKSAPQAPAPVLRAGPVSKIADQGGSEPENEAALAKRLGELPVEQSQLELIKMAKRAPIALTP